MKANNKQRKKIECMQLAARLAKLDMKTFFKVFGYDFLTFFSLFVILILFGGLILGVEKDIQDMVPLAKDAYNMLENMRSAETVSDMSSAQVLVRDIKLHAALIVIKVVGYIVGGIILFFLLFGLLQSSCWNSILKKKFNIKQAFLFGLINLAFYSAYAIILALFLFSFKLMIATILGSCVLVLLRHITLIFGAAYFSTGLVKDTLKILKNNLVAKKSLLALAVSSVILILLVILSALLSQITFASAVPLILIWLIFISWNKLYIRQAVVGLK